MLRIEIKFTVNGQQYERTYRTNDSGCNLFTGVSNNNQISCESGFNHLPRIKKWIRWHVTTQFDPHYVDLSKIKYTYISSEFIR